jgi:hypothetical protein
VENKKFLSTQLPGTPTYIMIVGSPSAELKRLGCEAEYSPTVPRIRMLGALTPSLYDIVLN